MEDLRRITIEDKALKINLTTDIYGSFSEIGAGQEVAANFFKAGGSSGTIAYSHSAYDMKVSDRIYGKAKRYVCEERLTTMLNREFDSVIDNLSDRKKDTRFFSFCNTVESLNYHETNQGQGWVGIRFQVHPEKRPNNIILHVKLHDQNNQAQQEALGILGVNLIYTAFFHSSGSLDEFISGMLDELPQDRIEIDMLRVEGHDYEHFDNRILALNLVKRGVTAATMFDQTGKVLQPASALYKKNILLLRGRFRPVTKVHIDMLKSAREKFYLEEDVKKKNVREVFELTIKDLTAGGRISDKDFVDRAELLGALGHTVMISNYLKYYKVIDYLSDITKGYKIGVILGIYNIHNIFDEKYYRGLSGGLLEAFGRGFGRNSKLYIYPAINYKNGQLYEFKDVIIPKDLNGLLTYMIDNNKIEALTDYNYDHLDIQADDVLAKIKRHEPDETWDQEVPERVAKAIKFMRLFNYKPAEEPEAIKLSKD